MRIATPLIVLVGLILVGGQAGESDSSMSSSSVGPVSELILRSSQGELRLKNAGGRLVWNDSPWGKALSIATVDLGRVIMAVAKSDQMDQELRNRRDEMEKQYREGLDERRRRLQELDREIAAAPSRSSEQSALMKRRQEMSAEMSQWTKEIEKRRFEVAADILRNSYADVCSAVDVIAAKMSVDIVLTRHDADVVDHLRYEDLLGFIKSLSVIRSPAEIDITEDVIAELGAVGE